MRKQFPPTNSVRVVSGVDPVHGYVEHRSDDPRSDGPACFREQVRIFRERCRRVRLRTIEE